MQTFSYTPLSGAVGDFQFNVFKAQFGDGYTQEVGNGINNLTSQWPLSFEVLETDAKQIISFFKNHSGFLPFKWTPPLEDSPRVFVVNKYKVTVIAGQCPLYRIDATFEERYE